MTVKGIDHSDDATESSTTVKLPAASWQTGAHVWVTVLILESVAECVGSAGDYQDATCSHSRLVMFHYWSLQVKLCCFLVVFHHFCSILPSVMQNKHLLLISLDFLGCLR